VSPVPALTGEDAGAALARTPGTQGYDVNPELRVRY
jgi:hypothetical protein